MKQLAINLLLVISPLVTACVMALVWSLFNPHNSNRDGYAIWAFMMLLITPLLVLTGITFSLVTKNKPNAKRLSFWGYALPALILCSFTVAGTIFDILFNSK